MDCESLPARDWDQFLRPHWLLTTVGIVSALLTLPLLWAVVLDALEKARCRRKGGKQFAVPPCTPVVGHYNQIFPFDGSEFAHPPFYL